MHTPDMSRKKGETNKARKCKVKYDNRGRDRQNKTGYDQASNPNR